LEFTRTLFAPGPLRTRDRSRSGRKGTLNVYRKLGVISVMKVLLSVCALTVSALASFGQEARSSGQSREAAPFDILSTRPFGTVLNQTNVPPGLGPLLGTNISPQVRAFTAPGFLTNRVLRLLKRQGTPLQPGLYKTEPYTCIVAVPEQHLDERMVIGKGGVAPELKMPTLKPDLEFKPLRQK